MALFLFRAKLLLDSGDVTFASRQKNQELLVELGLLVRHQIEILRSLTPRDYVETLPPERSDETDAWVFGWNERGRELYIKLKILMDQGEDYQLYCVSFHGAESPLAYPYR